MISLTALIAKRGNLCEWCNMRPAVHRHHCLIHRMKGQPELDDERNLMIVCQDCHDSGIVNSRNARVIFWQRQCKRYPDMAEWYNGLLLKVKDEFPQIEAPRKYWNQSD